MNYLLHSDVSRRTLYALSACGLGLALLAAIPFMSKAAIIFLNSGVTPGSSGATVSSLQQFLAGDSHIYPAGLVTGFYGPLTTSAVKQFQVAYGISPVGQVGPITLAQINSLAARGLSLDVTAPATSNIGLSVGRTSALVSWNTNEITRMKVFYDTHPLGTQEANINFTDPLISGTMIQDTSLSMSHSVTLPNLSANTTYYYMVLSADASGNVTVSPQATFTTTN